jgi:hypothetical protein
MNMRKLTAREKNMGVVVFFLCLFIIQYGMKYRSGKRLELAKEELMIAETRFNETKTQVQHNLDAAAKAHPKLAAKEADKSASINLTEKKATLFLLRDITFPELEDKVKILSADKKGEGDYVINVEAEFAEMMSFLSFMERQDGKFTILQGSLTKGEGSPDLGGGKGSSPDRSIPGRSVKATLTLHMKG